MSQASGTLAAGPGWLVSGRFDMGFIGGVALLAIVSGLAVVQMPHLFGLILLLDLWLLGYHHVVATYTRLCFDRESFQQHKFLILYLPFIVFAGTVALAAGFGLWVLASIYLYWQWFHYTRQSWGISQGYRRKSADLVTEPEWFAKLAFYLIPLWGILYRSHQDPGTFLGLELRVIPVPGPLVDVVGVAACAVLALWIANRVRMWWHGRLPVAHTLYMASHFAIFAISYIAIEDISYGWLVVNIWHNLQYIIFTWMFNNRRFKEGVTPKARLLSTLSQTRSWPFYILFCLAISTTMYAGIHFLTAEIAFITIPVIVIYQTINFHHYIVDSLIWKVRRKSMREILGLNPA